jgi:hypothetical protein
MTSGLQDVLEEGDYLNERVSTPANRRSSSEICSIHHGSDLKLKYLNVDYYAVRKLAARDIIQPDKVLPAQNLA